MPLRTVLLDPSVNNFPRSRTRTELMKRIKLSCEPHPSYDLVSNSSYMVVLYYFLIIMCSVLFKILRSVLKPIYKVIHICYLYLCSIYYTHNTLG